MINIVGAGYSGLMTAYYLVKAGHRVRVFEKSATAGGLIQTLQNKYGLIETAANGFLDCDELQAVSRDIGVPLIPTQKQSRKRYIYQEKPRRWPLSFSETAQALPRLLQFGFFRSDEQRPLKNETIEAYSDRIFGKAVTSRLLEPALRGIYAGEIRDMSASLIFSKYFNPKRPRLRSTVSPSQGMGTWILGLKQWLQVQGVELVFDQAIAPKQLLEGRWVLATSAPAAAELLSEASVKTAALLKQVQMLPIVTVTLFFAHREKLRGFGVLFPKTAEFNALGVLFNHDIFSGRSDLQSETWILGGAQQKSIMEKSDSVILERLNMDRRRIFSEENSMVDVVITRWPQALPHYTVELENILSQINAPENIHLVGNYLGGIGLSQMLFQAKQEATRWSH